MAQQTEAACLLETGALYHTRVMLRAPEADPIFAGIKAGAVSLYFGDEPIYHFDFEGRWQRAFVKGLHYLKGLDGAVQSIDRVREGENLVLKRRALPADEAAAVDELVRSACRDLLRDLDSGRLERIDPPPKARPFAEDSLRDFLDLAARWDAPAWLAQRERYRSTYGPLPVLPPDIPNALVVQATVGHRARSAGEFADHAHAVAALVGRRLAQHRVLFLAGGDVLRRPADEVASHLATLARVFPIDPGMARRGATDPSEAFARLEGVHTFLDDPGSPRPGPDEWRRFRALHLLRVNVGVVSGDPAVRALYGKSWRDEDLATVVSDAKCAGLGVGLVVPAGAGGEEHAARHVEATTGLLNGLDVGPGDLVSLLDAAELGGTPAGNRGFARLSPPRLAEQQGRLKLALLELRTRTGAKVAAYSLEKQQHAAG